MNESMLCSLDYDVLLQIFEELRPSKNLRPLSRTCRWLYQVVAPILYRSCFHRFRVISTIRSPQIPGAIWPYIRSLQILCKCPDSGFAQALLNLTEHGRRDNRVLCAPLESLSLHQELAGMPNLRTLTLALHEIQYYRHGISLRTLAKILALKQLRHLNISFISILPTPLDDDLEEPILSDSIIAPLESFKYQLLPHRYQLRLSSEAQLLERLSWSLHSSLERIWIPTEPAPLETFSSLDWPRLRELRLYGERGPMPDTPIISLLANLPELRVLTLNLTDGHGVEGRPIWPHSIRMSFPWSNLRRLSLSHPSVEDSIYSFLPETMQSLALRAWQHQCSRLYNRVQFGMNTDIRPALPIPSPHTLQRVLSNVKSNLRELEIEYKAEGTETEQSLLTTIVSRFPHLSSLEIHRYRAEGETHAPLQEIACSLQPLSKLRVIKLNLDLPGAPKPSAFLWGWEKVSFHETIVANLTVFARHCPSSLQEIWGYTDEVFQAWLVCDVIREDGALATDIGVTQCGHPIPYELRR